MRSIKCILIILRMPGKVIARVKAWNYCMETVEDICLGVEEEKG